MSSKKWFLMFCLTLAFIGVVFVSANILIDPFGVFGDVIFKWDSYSQTQNPRVGKTEYLKDHWQEYDSYIVGCSSTSSYPTYKLNEYYDASFYNLIMYGADMLDVENTVDYLIDNYTVKNLVLNVYIDNGAKYGEGEDTLSNNMHPDVADVSKLKFYSKYIFLDPSYAIAKVKDSITDTELSQPFDVFDVKTGAYDKRARDAEPIGDLIGYLESYPVFANYPTYGENLCRIDECMESVAKIRDMCSENGISFTVVCAPVYYDYLNNFDSGKVSEFYEKLADVTPFWDFSMSSVSYEPRYFYDSTHFRNDVGAMALARVFGDESVYVPEDFGKYVTPENVNEVTGAYFTESNDTDDYTAQVPVLMYHQTSETSSDDMTVSAKSFENQIAALAENGYTAITVDELINYVDNGTELPEKPVLITFDDGYLGNYALAYPILEKYGMKATIFVIGSSVGSKENYKDTDYSVTPHFDADEMKEMSDSGVISIQSHTYDMHQWAPYEDGEARENILIMDGETEEEYIGALTEDFKKSASEIESVTGKDVISLAYPSGEYDMLSQWVLNTLGVRVTFGVESGINTIVKGLPQSLYAMDRITVTDNITGEELISILES